MKKRDTRGWSSSEGAPKWTPVEVPRPVFEGAAEKARLEEAIRRGRRPGESLAEFMERVNAEARPVGDRELPAGDRVPGEEG